MQTNLLHKIGQMSKLHFYYSVMNAGKTTLLLQTEHNYKEYGKRVLLFTSALDTRSGPGKISSRIGLGSPAHALTATENLFSLVEAEHTNEKVSAVLLDEVNFMTPEHIEQASDIADYLDIPVLAYGLKNNAFGNIFGPSIEKLLALSEDINEVKTICHCGKKATMILRYGKNGKVDRDGNVLMPGGEQQYVSVCRRHYKEGDIGQKVREMIKERGEKYHVHCTHCGTGYDSVFDHDQAGDCASYVRGNEITGAYGSTITDGSIFRFTNGRPATVRNGVVCDPCVKSFIDQGILVETDSSW